MSVNRTQVALSNAGYNERVARNAKRPPRNPYHYYICRRCGMSAGMLTTIHAARCGFSSVEEMKESPDVIEYGGRRKKDESDC